MNQEQERAAREGEKRDSRDGFAALAIVLLTVGLITLLVIKII